MLTLIVSETWKKFCAGPPVDLRETFYIGKYFLSQKFRVGPPVDLRQTFFRQFLCGDVELVLVVLKYECVLSMFV